MPKTLKNSYKNLNKFILFNKIENTDANFSHEICLRYKLKKGEQKSFWYAKSLGKKRDEAILETLAQEFYRLILPQQPKTRRAISKTKTGEYEYHIISKQIPYFDEKFFLFPNKTKLILDNSPKGLAATQVLALLLNEVDFKAGNVGVDEAGKVIKIDGGLSFIKLNPRFKYLYEGKNLDITQADLEALPNLVNYEACNWLHHIQWNLDEKRALKTEPTILDKKINQSPDFKNEVYQTILRIIALPDELIQFFTQSYIANPEDVTKFSNFIIARKQQLSLAAEQMPAFNEYRHSNQAREKMLDFLNYLKTFKTMRKSFLLSEFEDKYKINIESTILGDVIKEYTPIKNFAGELDNYYQNLKNLSEEIDFDLLRTENFILDPDREKIISFIVSLKEIITVYLTSPTIVKNNALYATFQDVKEAIKEDFEVENPIISALIGSINKVLSASDNLKKIKKPIPTPRANKSTQPLPPIAFFNESHRKVSDANHQHNNDTSPHNCYYASY